MHFAQPFWIVLGIIVCTGLFMLCKILERRRQSTLTRFAAPHLLSQLTRHISLSRRRIKTLLFILAIFCCCIALARPQYGFSWIEIRHKGIDILFALDTSKSMQARDIKPNRLERARFAIMDFVSQLGGDRIGLLPFAGSTFLACPLTLDYSAFEQTLAAINTETIPQAGTNLAVVITEAERILTASSNHKILILLTDGENLQGEALDAAKDAAAKGMKIYSVAVGTREGELIPADKGGFIKDSAGRFITSRLDEKTLDAIAEITGGISVPLGDRGQGLETIYRQKLGLIPREELGERRQKVPIERYAWPLSLAILLLSVEFLLMERKYTGIPVPAFIKALRQRFMKNRHVGLSLLAFLLVSAATVQPILASPAEKSFANGDYQKAAELYRLDLQNKPNDPRRNYNFGTTAYKNNLFDEAISSFAKALKTSDLDLQQKAYYNKANSHYKKGVEAGEANTQETIAEWQNAVDAYSAALKLKSDDADARHNLDFVEKKLEELKQQQQQKEQEKQKKDQSQQNKQDNEKNGAGQNSPEKSPPPPAQSAQPSQEKNSEQQNGSSQEEPRTAAQGDRQKNNAGAGPGGNAGEPLQSLSSGEQDRQLQGKMTRDEAEKLLRSLRGEEKTLNFAPAAAQETDDQPERNW